MVLFGQTSPNNDRNISDLNGKTKEIFPKMKILLFGHRGQVGTELKNHFPEGFQLFPSSIDITDSSSIENEVGNIHPDVVINAAAYTSVDEAEIQKEKAFEVNAIAPIRLANIALKTSSGSELQADIEADKVSLESPVEVL